MNDKITITKDGVETTYIREDKVVNTKGTGLYREVEYASYTWNVIAEDNESLTLLMKNCLKIDRDSKLMAFNSENDKCIWWKGSTIRKYLNNEFLKKLNKNDLLPMTTEIWFQGESKVTVDKVRMLTIDEIFRLPKSILSKDLWYWSLSPYYYYGSSAYVFNVYTSGQLNTSYVYNTSGAVAPVIKLKRCTLKEC